MHENDDFIIRQLTGADLEEFNNLLRYAFQVTNRELTKTGWEIDEIKREKAPILESAHVLGWFHHNKLVSQIVIYPMLVNIFGTLYPMGGITGVATYPEYTKRGLAHTLMADCLKHMRAHGQSVAFLYPYSIPFYRKMGWEIISDAMTFSLKDTQLPRFSNMPDRVERVSMDHDDLKQVHDHFARRRHGALIRDQLAWTEYWRWDVDDMITAIYYNEQHTPTGYIVYYLEEEIFHIKEMIYLDQDARHGLWSYVSAHFSMVTEVRSANYTGEPVAFLFEDSEIKETITPYIMARIVDLPEFIAHFPFVKEAAGEVRFEVEDTMAPWNQGMFTIRWQEGKGVCEKSAVEADCDTTVDIQTLMTMFAGYKRPAYLQRNQRLQATPQIIALLEQAIPNEKPYFSDFF